MGREAEGFGSYTIVCDDPYHRMCSARFGPYFGKYRVVRLAQENGWYVSDDHYACPNCIELHRITVNRKVVNGSMTREEADESGDPFTAAFVAMIFGGDPLTAGLITMFTGSTPLGVIVGIMAGDRLDKRVMEEAQLTFGGGETSGGGAGGTFEETPTPACSVENVEAGVPDAPSPMVCEPTSPVCEREEIGEVPVCEREDTQGLPVIVDPFAPKEESGETDEIGGESERFIPAETGDGETTEVHEEIAAADTSDTGSDTSY